MKYRRFGSVFLLFLLIGFCLYGSRVHITENAASAISEQTDTEATEDSGDRADGYSLGFYEKHYQRFLWDGNAFALIEQSIYVYDEEQGDYVEQEHYIKQE